MALSLLEKRMCRYEKTVVCIFSYSEDNLQELGAFRGAGFPTGWSAQGGYVSFLVLQRLNKSLITIQG